MREYTISPNKDATRWAIELEGVAPAESYAYKDAAIDEAAKLAKSNKPSKVVILDEDHQVVDEKKY